MKDSDPKVSAIMYTVDSLNRLRDHYVSVDRDCVGLCIRLLDEYRGGFAGFVQRMIKRNGSPCNHA